MTTTLESTGQVLAHYFEAWRQQDSDKLVSLYGIYKVKPFGLEEYSNTDKISFWRGYMLC